MLPTRTKRKESERDTAIANKVKRRGQNCDARHRVAQANLRVVAERRKASQTGSLTHPREEMQWLSRIAASGCGCRCRQPVQAGHAVCGSGAGAISVLSHSGNFHQTLRQRTTSTQLQHKQMQCRRWLHYRRTVGPSSPSSFPYPTIWHHNLNLNRHFSSSLQHPLPVKLATTGTTRQSLASLFQRRLYSHSTMAELKWSAARVRQTFLDYFEKNGHTIGTSNRSSSSLGLLKFCACSCLSTHANHVLLC